MRIALYEITSTVSYGGIQTFVWGMAKALAEKGHIVHVFGGKGNIRGSYHDNIEVFTFPYLSRQKFPDFGSRFRKFGERLSFNMASFGFLVKGHYDFIYIHKPYDMPVALLSARRSAARVVFGSGGTEFFPGYKHLVKKIDYFFACSKFNADQIEAYCGIRPSVLPNGIDTKVFAPLDPSGELKEQLRIPDADTVIVSACRLVGWKGIRFALEAVAALMLRKHKITYLIIGDGEEKPALESHAKKLGIQNKVFFLGSIKNSELPVYYSVADIAVFPSVANETFGISIAEAMACGVPVVSTCVGGIPEVVTEGTGLLVPPREGPLLAEAIESLMTDRTLMEKTGFLAREWIVTSFSWDNVARKFETLIGCNI